jgi:hypothetical protein
LYFFLETERFVLSVQEARKFKLSQTEKKTLRDFDSESKKGGHGSAFSGAESVPRQRSAFVTRAARAAASALSGQA